MSVSTMTGTRRRRPRLETSPHGFKGTITHKRDTADRLVWLKEKWPIGAEIRHYGGRMGQIREDEPVNVPGTFDGRPTQVCTRYGQDMVCASWQNSEGLVWVVWVPAETVVLTGRRWNNNGRQR